MGVRPDDKVNTSKHTETHTHIQNLPYIHTYIHTAHKRLPLKHAGVKLDEVPLTISVNQNENGET